MCVDIVYSIREVTETFPEEEFYLIGLVSTTDMEYGVYKTRNMAIFKQNSRL